MRRTFAERNLDVRRGLLLGMSEKAKHMLDRIAAVRTSGELAEVLRDTNEAMLDGELSHVESKNVLAHAHRKSRELLEAPSREKE